MSEFRAIAEQRDAAWQAIADELNSAYNTNFTVQQIKKRCIDCRALHLSTSTCLCRYSNEDQRLKGNFKRLRDQQRNNIQGVNLNCSLGDYSDNEALRADLA